MGDKAWPPVCLLIWRFDPGWNISTTIEWIVIRFVVHINCPHERTAYVFGELQIFFFFWD